jgi:hypothetical protein
MVRKLVVAGLLAWGILSLIPAQPEPEKPAGAVAEGAAAGALPLWYLTCIGGLAAGFSRVPLRVIGFVPVTLTVAAVVVILVAACRCS